MRIKTTLLSLVLVSMLSGCMNFNFEFKLEKLGTAYGTVCGIRPYDRTFFKANVFDFSNCDGELVSFEVWPVVGVGAGLVGARVQLLPIEFGLGTLFYAPKPRVYSKPIECPTGQNPNENNHGKP